MATIEQTTAKRPPTRDADTSRHDAVLAFTQRVFGTPATIRTETDPEIGTEGFVVTVAARGSFEEVQAGYTRWHRELDRTAAELTPKYTLSLAPPHDAD